MRLEVRNAEEALLGSVEYDGCNFIYEGITEPLFRDGEYVRNPSNGRSYTKADGDAFVRAMQWHFRNAYAYGYIVYGKAPRRSGTGGTMPRVRSIHVKDDFKGIESLVDFMGYGEPAGRFWFMGIEEAGAAEKEHNRKEHEVRLEFRNVEDLPKAEAKLRMAIGKEPNMEKLRPTWATMSRIILRLEHDSEWRNREAVRNHQATKLGRRQGQAFLTEVLPLRKAADDRWHRTWWPFDRWKDWSSYSEAVRPYRFARLRRLLDKHRPEFLFWYGSWYWRKYRDEIFPELAGQSVRKIAGGRAEVGIVGPTTVVFTRFFGYRSLPTDMIDEIVADLGL
jgi:hypothetical protein